LEAGEYPGVEIETELIPEDDRRLFGQIAEVLEARIDNDIERERMRRLIAYWGSKDAATTRTFADEDGTLVYGEVRQGIYEAFGLPWLGGETPDTTIEKPDTEPSHDSKEPGKPGTPEPGTTSAEQSRTGRRDQGPVTPRGTRDGPRRLTNSQLLAVRQDIARWSEGNKPQRPNDLNRLAYEVVSRLNWGHLCVAPWVRSRLFTEDTVILRDTKPARLQHFLLEREPWVKKGIEAYHALRTSAADLDPQEAEGFRRSYASMQRKLGVAVRAKIRERLPTLGTGETWDIAATATQVLLARAWLRGNVSPLSASWEQWRAVIADDGNPVSNPQDRVDSWNALVNATGGIQGVLRTLLRQWLALPQFQPDHETQNPDTAIAAVSNSLVRAVLALQETFRMHPLPQSVEGVGKKLVELKLLAEVTGEVNQKLRGIPRYEVERLTQLAQGIERMSRQSSLREHIKRVDAVVEEIAGFFPHNVAHPVQEWRTAKQRLNIQGFLSTEGDTPGSGVEKFMDRVSDNDVPNPEDLAQSLSWTLDAPSADLRLVHTGFDTAERVVAQLLEYVEEYLEGTSEAGGTLDDIHNIGARIRVTTDGALHGLEFHENE
jgi:hypothetical protein